MLSLLVIVTHVGVDCLKKCAVLNESYFRYCKKVTTKPFNISIKHKIAKVCLTV